MSRNLWERVRGSYHYSRNSVKFYVSIHCVNGWQCTGLFQPLTSPYGIFRVRAKKLQAIIFLEYPKGFDFCVHHSLF